MADEANYKYLADMRARFSRSARAEPKQVAQAAPAPSAEAGPQPGSSAYWRGPERQRRDDPAPPADEAARVASARRSRGHATGEAHADPNIPYQGSAVSPSASSAAAPSESSVAYDAGGPVPDRATVNITVQARRV